MEKARTLTGYPSVDGLHKKDGGFFENHPIIPGMSVYDAYYLISKFENRKDAIVCDELVVSTKEFLNDVGVVARAFKALGLKKQQVCTVLTPNFYQSIVIFFACNKIGIICTFLNCLSSIDEIKKYLNMFESSLLVHFNRGENFNREIEKNTQVKHIVVIEQEDLSKKGFSSLDGSVSPKEMVIRYDDLRLLAKSYKKPICTWQKGSNVALYSFTSGTTGQPKVVVLTNENIIACGIYQMNTCHITSDGGTRKSLACVPFCYPYGFSTSVLTQMLDGIGIILAPNISKDNVNYYLSKNPHIVFGSPALLELVMNHTDKGLDLSSIEYFISGGDFLQDSQYDNGMKFFKEHNSKALLCNGFGNAETVSCTTMPIGVDHKPDTVGKLMYGSDAVIIDSDTMEERHYGEEGLLCVRGKHVFKEYLKEPDITAKAMVTIKGKSYFNTGTVGILSEDGYFKLTGRESRFYINANLNKIYCDYVQNVISNIDEVDSCAVVKVSHPEKLYVGKAYIVLKKGVVETDETMTHVIDKVTMNFGTIENPKRLKDYEVPEYFEFIETLPKTVADKVDYKKLEELEKIERKVHL